MKYVYIDGFDNWYLLLHYKTSTAYLNFSDFYFEADPFHLAIWHVQKEGNDC